MISFGLVNIPVGIYPATSDDEIGFHLLHEKDSGRIKNQRVCTVCNKTVEYGELVKGYEYKKGSYVVITDEDFEKVNVAGSQSINITDFVDSTEIDPMHYDAPYYIVPEEKSETSYALLREALKSTGKVAIATVVFRSREHLAAIRASDNALMLDTMHFPDDVREAEGIPGDEVKVGKRELEMATMLVKAMSAKFDPNAYKDTYKAALQELIDKKVAGEDVETPTIPIAPTNVVDIMAHLKASLERSGSSASKAKKIAV